MFGLNNNIEAKNCVLLAEWNDVSMIRNQIMFFLGQYLYKKQGLYASDFRLIELYLNNQYNGLYLLAEQNEVNKNRVNIHEADKTYNGIDIGYLLELDNYADQEKELEKFEIDYNNNAKLYKFDEPNGQSIFEINTDSEQIHNWYAIKSQINSNEQNNFIKKYLSNIYKILYKAIIEKEYYEFNSDHSDIVKSNVINNEYQAIANVLYVDSAVSTLILQEILCNYDISNSSFYMSVDMSVNGDKKLHFTTPWDADNALGNRMYNGYESRENRLYAANSLNPWLTLLYQSETIRTKVKEKWQQINNDQLFNKLYLFIDTITTKYEKQFQTNYALWKNIGLYLDELESIPENNPSYDSYGWILGLIRDDAGKNCKTQKDASNYVKTWLTKRL